EERVVGDARVPVVCAEDLVAVKVLAGRPRDLDGRRGHCPRAPPRPRPGSDPWHPAPAGGRPGPPRPRQRAGASRGRRAADRDAAPRLKRDGDATHLVSNYDWWDKVIGFQVVPGPEPPFVGSAWLPVRLRVERHGKMVTSGQRGDGEKP